MKSPEGNNFIKPELNKRFRLFKDYYNYLLNFSNFKKNDIRSFQDIQEKSKYDFLKQNLYFDEIVNETHLSIDFIKIFYDLSVLSEANSKELIGLIQCDIRPLTRSKNYYETQIKIEDKLYKAFFLLVYVNGYYQGLSIRICHPDEAIINLIENVFSANYYLTCVEYSADLYSNELGKLFKIIACTLTQKHSRSSVNKIYPSTYYGSNPRKAHSVGSYAYLKPINDPEYVRIECRYKRPFFRKKKMKIFEAVNRMPEEVFSKLDFKIFNLKKYLRKKSKEENYNYANFLEGIRKFELNFFKHFSEIGGGGVLAVKKYTAQNIANSHRFFDDYPFKEYFFKQLKDKTFI
jgi:hypothetical protein